MPCLTLRAVQLNPFSCKKSYIVECSANFVTIEAFLTMCAAWCVLLCPVLCIYLYYIYYILHLSSLDLTCSLQPTRFEALGLLSGLGRNMSSSCSGVNMTL